MSSPSMITTSLIFKSSHIGIVTESSPVARGRQQDFFPGVGKLGVWTLGTKVIRGRVAYCV